MIPCAKCSGNIDDYDKYCRHCGAAHGVATPFYHTAAGIWLLFLVIGPFNILFLLRSKVISNKAKLLYAALFILIFLALCLACYLALMKVISLYSELGAL